MEQKTFVAIILSFVVLYAWATITTKPAINIEGFNRSSQQAGIYNVAKKASKPFSLDPAKESQLPASPLVSEEKIDRIETEHLSVEFSNIGGVLNKIYIKDYAISLPISEIAGIEGYETTSFVAERLNDHEIMFTCEIDKFIVKKIYTVSGSDYTITITSTLLNNSDMSKLVNSNTVGMILDMSNLDIKNKNHYERDRSMFEYIISSNKGVERKNNAFQFSSKDIKSHVGYVNWLGFRDRYFCALFKPLYETSGYHIAPLNNNKLYMAIHSKAIRIDPKSQVDLTSFIYAGPEDFEKLRQYKYGLENVTRYYRLTLFDATAKMIYSAMRWLHKLIPNWGVCIILISTIIYLAMYPLTLKSMMSMKNMQALNPKIVSIKEKYKDNPQKINIEIMDLYKKHKVNPLGGCLPMVLQMPVFVGLYQVLWRSVYLKGSSFLWIKDLSEPDRLFVFSFKLPIIGSDFNILPIVMIFIMIVQQKLTSKAMIMTDSSQVAQQKMMSIIMPIFLGIVFYKFASGLTLYFTMFYIFSTLMQWRMSRDLTIAR